MLDEVLAIIQADLIDLAAKTGFACAALVGVGLTFFGIKWVTSKIIGFFNVLSGGYGEYEDSYEYYKSGQRDSDYDYDIDG